MRPLRKTTIIIWSEANPFNSEMELVNLAQDATDGDSYCSKQSSQIVDNPRNDPDWDGTEFFDNGRDTGE